MLKNFDYQCDTCGHTHIDVIAEQDQKTFPCEKEGCAGTMFRTWGLMTASSPVHGDECDVWVRNGLCNSDGSPRHFTSRKDLRQEAAKRGLVNHVEHMPGRGTDKSRNTQRFI